MSTLRELYKLYGGSEEYNEFGEVKEMKITRAKIKDWAKEMSEEDYFELERLVTAHACAGEIQGFIYGFRYGVQIMNECLPKGGEQV